MIIRKQLDVNQIVWTKNNLLNSEEHFRNYICRADIFTGVIDGVCEIYLDYVGNVNITEFPGVELADEECKELALAAKTFFMLPENKQHIKEHKQFFTRFHYLRRYNFPQISQKESRLSDNQWIPAWEFETTISRYLEFNKKYRGTTAPLCCLVISSAFSVDE